MTLESIAPLSDGVPSRCPPWQPERPGPTRREPRRAQRSYTTRRDTIRQFTRPTCCLADSRCSRLKV